MNLINKSMNKAKVKINQIIIILKFKTMMSTSIKVNSPIKIIMMQQLTNYWIKMNRNQKNYNKIIKIQKKLIKWTIIIYKRVQRMVFNNKKGHLH